MKRYLILVLLLLCSTVNADTWSPSPIKPAGQTVAGGEGWQKGYDCKFAPSDGNIVYRVNDTSGIWKSTDGGASWEPSNQGFRFIGGASIGVHPTDPNIVLVGGSSMESAGAIRSARESGIARTIDGGANWTVATSTTNGADYSYLRCMFAREVFATSDLFAWVGGTSSTVYCGTTKQGLLRSTDLGFSWSVLVPYSVTGQIYDIDLTGTNTPVKILVAGANSFTQYTDNGASYSTTSTSGTYNARIVEVDQNNSNLIYVAGSAAGTTTIARVYKSTTGIGGFSDSGVDNAEWSSRVATGYMIDSMRMSDADTNKLYINFWANAYPGYYYYSSNAGAAFNTPANGSWDLDGTVALFNASIAASEGSQGRTFIASHPTDSTIVLVQNALEQMLKSNNSGVSFTYSNSGYMGYTPHATIAKTSEAIVVGSTTSIRTGNDFEIWKSLDSQATWTKIPKPSGQSDDSDAIAIEPNTDTPVLILANVKTGTTNAYLYRSDSGSFGSSWTEKTPNFTHSGGGCRYIKFHGTDTNYIYAGQYRSSDKGVTWTKPFSNGVLDVYEGNNDIVYSITSSGAVCWILKCANARAATPTFAATSPTFTMSSSSSAWAIGQAFCSSPTNSNKWYVPAGILGVYVVHNGSSSADLKNVSNGLTTDGTANWDYVQCVADPNDANVVYALAECHPNFRGGGIFKSTDGGNTWVSISSGTKLAYANSTNMNVDPNTGYLHVHGYNGTFIYNADAPLIDIEIPTTLNYYGTSSATITISGSASDADGIDEVTYVMTGDTTGSGVASGTTAWTKTALAVNLGTTTVTFTAMDLSGNSATDYIVIGRAATPPENEVPDMTFPYTSETITINGAATESIWSDAVAHPIDLVISGNPIGTVSAEVKGLWDENYIYVLITATDTTKNNDTGTTAVHLDTAGEVYWDADNSGGAYAEGDFHFIFPWNQSDFIWEVGGNTSTVSSSMSSTANGYTLEAKFPWSLLGISATNSTTLAADFQTDTDVDGGNTRELAMSAFNAFDTNYYDLSDLGLILLGTQTQAEGGGGAGSSTVTKITGLLANWNFNETSGSSTFDTSVNLNHGTMSANAGTSSCSRQIGRDGIALQVVGSASVNCGSPASLDDIGTRTMVAVIKATDDSGDICSKSGVWGSSNAGFWYFELSTTDALWFMKDFATTDPDILSANSVLVPNTWQTVAITWDGGSATSGFNYYINGELISQGVVSAGAGALVSDAALNYFIGNRGIGNAPFAGLIDNLQNYSRVLTAAEIRDASAFIQGTTSTALGITSLTADLYGSCSITFGTTTIVACFDYGVASGVYTGSTTAQNTGRTTVGVSDVIHAVSGLTAGTTYYYRLRVESPAYTVYGAESSFVTLSADATAPTIGINYPTSAANYQTTSSLPLLVTGTSSDNVSVSSVVWDNTTMGTTGTCVGTTQWNVQELPIQEGTNTVKFTATDPTGNQGTATINIYRNLDTPVTEIASPSANCTFSDGNPAFGTTGTSISLAGVAVDNYNGITQVTISNSATTTVNTATGTSSWSYTQRILAQLDDGLVFRAALDEANGVTQIKDSSIFASHGTNTGSVGTTTSKFGRSRYFDGVDDNISFFLNSANTLTDKISISAWVNSAIMSCGINCRKPIVEKLGLGSLFIEDNILYGRIRTTGSASVIWPIYANIGSNINQWMHCVFVMDLTAGTSYWYVNGLVGTSSVSTAGQNPIGTDTSLFVGKGESYKFKGYIDEVRIYNKALSQAEITQLYELTSPDQDNIIRATGHDVLSNQGTDTIHIGAFPTTTTSDATGVTYHSSQLNGTVNPNNNETTVWFDYGLSSGAYTGSSSTQVVTGDADTAIGIALGALNRGTEYFYRLVGSGTVGLTHGDEFSFSTLAGYTLEEVTGISKPLSWSMIGSTKFMVGLKAYGIYNPWTRWRSTADKKRLIDDTDEEITQAIEDL